MESKREREEVERTGTNIDETSILKGDRMEE